MSFLYDRFQSLTSPSDGGYSGWFLDTGHYIIARDSHGHPAFFIRYSEVLPGRNQAYALEGLEAILQYRAVVTVGGDVISGLFALIRCSSNEELAQRYFLELCGTLRHLLGSDPTAAQVDEGLSTFVRMFTLRTAPPKKTIIGLLGELLFIDQHPNPVACISAWHITSRDLVDFVFPGYALEVKCTSNSKRVHLVSYDQANSFRGQELYFLSVQLVQIASGMSGTEVLRRIGERCGDNISAVIRMWEVVTETLGSEIQAFLEFNFAHDAAVESMQYYDAAEIPAIRGNLPNGVTRVNFASDFSLATEIDIHTQTG